MDSLIRFSSQQRRQFRFLLDVAKTEEAELVSIIQELKAKRSFTRAIRVGLRLFWSLMNGRIDVLVSEFPWVVERLQSPLGQLQEQLDRIEQKMNLPVAAPSPAALPAPPPRLAAPKPFDDEDLPELTIVESTSKENPTFNMILSTMSIGAKPENIPREILEYGIAMGRVPAGALVEHDQKRGIKPPPITPSADPKAMAGSNLTFEVPDFDDDLLDLLEIP